MAIILVESGMSIQAAVDSAQAGDIVLVKNGVYHEEVVVNNKNNIRIIAKGEKVILNGRNQLFIAFAVQDSEGVEISGFAIKNYLFNGIDAIGGGEHRFINNRITNIGLEGIQLVGDCEQNLVWNNDISRVGYEGIFVATQNNWIVGNKTYKNQTGIFIFVNNNAVISNTSFRNSFAGMLSDSANTLVLGNRFDNNRDIGIFLVDTFACIALDNKTDHNKGEGLFISNSFNTFVAENRVVENSDTGIDLSGEFNVLQNNRVIKNRDNGILLEVDAVNNSLIRNRLEDNRPSDLVVLNLDNNNFLNNKCCKSNPRQLCKHCD